MSSTAVAPVSSGVVSSIKSLPDKLGSVAGRIGGKLSPLVHKVADSKVVSWGGEQVRKVAVPDQVIRGWQDVYKGLKTLERGTKTIRTVKIIREPGALAGRGASGVAKGASSAGKAIKAVKAANGAKGAASGAAKGGDLLLRAGTKVSATAGKAKIPGGFREITKVDVTKAELIGKSGQKIVRGAKFRLGGSGAGESLGKGLSKVYRGGGGAGKGGQVVLETRTTVTNAAAKGFKKPFGVAAIKAGLRNIFQGAMKAAKVSGIVSFAISLFQNGYGVLSGQIGLPEAMGGLVRDTAGGFVSGGFAAVFSGGVLAIAGGLGLTAGLPVFLLGLGASILGYAICNALFNAIIGDRLKGFVERIFGG